MKQSRYDRTNDGICDRSACHGVLTVTDRSAPYPAQINIIQNNLKTIGITLHVLLRERTIMYGWCNYPAAHVGLCAGPGWGKDYADAFTFGPALFWRQSIGPYACCNYALVGASRSLLRHFHYPVRRLPNVDGKMAQCASLTGSPRVRCWVAFDRKVMEDVVPWVPLLFDNNVDITSSRIAAYSFDQFGGLAALDRLAITPAA
jgi:hypothetical protein